MAFSSLSQRARARILLELKGAAQYIRDANAATAATIKLEMATKAEAAAATTATRRTFLFGQAMYTLRRYAFFGTLAVVGLGAAALKMGFDFNISMQTAVVSLKNFTHSTAEAQKEANYLYVLAAKTPFEFPDVALAARRLLPSFNGNLQQTNQLLETIGNSLASFGVTSGAKFQQATLALQHMMTIGRVTGQVLYQLGRDNIPMQRALEQAFNATGAQIKDAVAQGAISAQDAITALNRYVANPANNINNAAKNLGLKTLQGNWTTFRDLVAASFGSAELGGFNKLAAHLKGINSRLIDIAQNKGHLTVTKLAQGINDELTPGTDRIMHTFTLFIATLQGTMYWLNRFAAAIDAVITNIGKITGKFGGATNQTKLLGKALGLLIALWIVYKGVMIAVEVALGAYALAEGVVNGVLWTRRALMKSLIFWQTLEATKIEEYIVNGGKFNRSVEVHKGRVADLARTIKGRYLPAIGTWIAAQWTLVASLAATEVELFGIAALTMPLWALVAIIIAITAGLVILYFKWKPFRDLVNETATWLWRNWKYADQALSV